MIKNLTTLGAVSAVGLLGVALPSQAAEFLSLSSCGTVLDGCIVNYTGGTALIEVLDAGITPVTGTPSANSSDDLLMGINAPGESGGQQQVKITFTAAANFSLPTLSLKPPGNDVPGTGRPFNDYRDNWNATLVGPGSPVWTLSDPGDLDITQQYPLADYPAPTANLGDPDPLPVQPPAIDGGSSIDWSFPSALSTKRAFAADWELSSSDELVSMLTLTYFSSVPNSETDPLFDDANSLRIHLTAEEMPVEVDVPEPASAIASAVALGLGMLSLRNKNRNSFRK